MPPHRAHVPQADCLVHPLARAGRRRRRAGVRARLVDTRAGDAAGALLAFVRVAEELASPIRQVRPRVRVRALREVAAVGEGRGGLRLLGGLGPAVAVGAGVLGGALERVVLGRPRALA